MIQHDDEAVVRSAVQDPLRQRLGQRNEESDRADADVVHVAIAQHHDRAHRPRHGRAPDQFDSSRVRRVSVSTCLLGTNTNQLLQTVNRKFWFNKSCR